MRNLVAIAIEAALEAGELLRMGFGTTYEVSAKEGRQNLVTAYDHAAEELIIKMIRSHFPDHSFFAEESGASSFSSTAPVTWIIDPLDGTVNFVHSIPHFSVSIAAAQDGVIVAGVVYQPMLDELFVAEKGGGATLNEGVLRVSSASSFDHSVMATGFPYNVHENPLHCIDRFAEMTRLGIPIRRLGSAALDLSYVAAGRFDAYWEVTLQPWDWAAGKLLVEEAGGKISRYDGSEHDLFTLNQTMLASNRTLHPQLMEHIRA